MITATETREHLKNVIAAAVELEDATMKLAQSLRELRAIQHVRAEFNNPNTVRALELACTLHTTTRLVCDAFTDEHAQPKPLS